jgi:hypothetical protein
MSGSIKATSQEEERERERGHVYRHEWGRREREKSFFMAPLGNLAMAPV